ncbi:hypothetical protein HK099_003885 [Clydaea vesicula]|uniref:Zn(2)-C6 fungal-type domain-containing protein n=1 Tax=Clydaea vesicula TaxID=447962 RepID=A0AAD5U2P7_9FUNG|nr:hypothetical protein HK099_003885 [Clydaea vesicula]
MKQLSQPLRQSKTKEACLRCRSLKRKCDSLKPSCSRSDCQYSLEKKKRGPKAKYDKKFERNHLHFNVYENVKSENQYSSRTDVNSSPLNQRISKFDGSTNSFGETSDTSSSYTTFENHVNTIGNLNVLDETSKFNTEKKIPPTVNSTDAKVHSAVDILFNVLNEELNNLNNQNSFHLTREEAISLNDDFQLFNDQFLNLSNNCNYLYRISVEKFLWHFKDAKKLLNYEINDNYHLNEMDNNSLEIILLDGIFDNSISISFLNLSSSNVFEKLKFEVFSANSSFNFMLKRQLYQKALTFQNEPFINITFANQCLRSNHPMLYSPKFGDPLKASSIFAGENVRAEYYLDDLLKAAIHCKYDRQKNNCKEIGFKNRRLLWAHLLIFSSFISNMYSFINEEDHMYMLDEEVWKNEVICDEPNRPLYLANVLSATRAIRLINQPYSTSKYRNENNFTFVLNCFAKNSVAEIHKNLIYWYNGIPQENLKMISLKNFITNIKYQNDFFDINCLEKIGLNLIFISILFKIHYFNVFSNPKADVDKKMNEIFLVYGDENDFFEITSLDFILVLARALASLFLIPENTGDFKSNTNFFYDLKFDIVVAILLRDNITILQDCLKKKVCGWCGDPSIRFEVSGYIELFLEIIRLRNFPLGNNILLTLTNSSKIGWI